MSQTVSRYPVEGPFLRTEALCFGLRTKRGHNLIHPFLTNHSARLRLIQLRSCIRSRNPHKSVGCGCIRGLTPL